MPTVEDFGAFKIAMYFGDHNPPHFHLSGPDFTARVRIDDLTVMAVKGKLPPHIRRRALRWATDHRELLEAKWAEYSEE